MTLSLLIAKVVAVVYVSSGLAVLLGSLNFNQIAEELERSPALTFCAGTIGLVSGTILVHFHNHWSMGWTVLITLLCWGFLAGGLLVVLLPQSLSWINRFYKHHRAWGLFMIGFGLFFGYLGFWH